MVGVLHLFQFLFSLEAHRRGVGTKKVRQMEAPFGANKEWEAACAEREV